MKSVPYRFLSSESEQLTWKSEGLPADDLSMENAVVILQVWVSFFADSRSLQAAV